MNLSFYYGALQALKAVDLPIAERQVTALIGPSGCGKSTFLRCFNRMHDLYPGSRYEGGIRFYPDNVNLLSMEVDPIEARMRIGMVFQKPNPFRKTIFANVAYGLQVRGQNNRRIMKEKVEQALQEAALWDEASMCLASMPQPPFNAGLLRDVSTMGKLALEMLQGALDALAPSMWQGR